MSLAVFFDEQAFLMQRFGGISRYITTLSTELARTGEISVHLFGGLHSNIHLDEIETTPGLHVHGMRRRDKLRINTLVTKISKAWRHKLFRKVRRKYSTVIYHPSYYNFDPHLAEQADASVVTFYDMIPEWQDSGSNSDNKGSLACQKRICLQKADLILSISQATLGDIRHFHPDLSPRNEVTLLASNITLPEKPQPLPSGVAPQKYFVLVGNRGHYKNGLAGIKAFTKMAPSRPDISLVAFGGEELNAEEKAILENAGLLSRWHYLKGGDDLLAVCYHHAAALVYPSIYEGFGLPVLEAIMLGCPVITTPKKSLPEVAGDAALYVEPDDIDGLCKAMCDVLENPTLRKSLVEKGIQQSQLFSWKKTAEATLKAYRAVLDKAS